MGTMDIGKLQNQSSKLVSVGAKDISQISTSASNGPEVTKPKKKICCACPETKRLRDECIVEHGESACKKWIEAHIRCLRMEGFNV